MKHNSIDFLLEMLMCNDNNIRNLAYENIKALPTDFSNNQIKDIANQLLNKTEKAIFDNTNEYLLICELISMLKKLNKDLIN